MDPNLELLAIACDHLGIHEEGGDNCGEWITKFQRYIGAKPGVRSWCMAFAQYCIASTESKLKVKSEIRRSESCVEVYEKTPVHMKREKPQPGCLVIWKRGNTNQGHVGIVETVLDDGRFTTIEGNTNIPGTKIDGVARKTRSMRPMRASGATYLRVMGFIKVF